MQLALPHSCVWLPVHCPVGVLKTPAASLPLLAFLSRGFHLAILSESSLLYGDLGQHPGTDPELPGRTPLPSHDTQGLVQCQFT